MKYMSEIGEIPLSEVNKEKTLNRNEIINQAKDGIERYRKNDFNITGLKPNTEYQIDQKNNAYPFGTAINGLAIIGSSEEAKDMKRGLLEKYPKNTDQINQFFNTDFFDTKNKDFRDKYIKTAEQMFNGMVEESLFKWPMNVDNYGKPNWTLIDKEMEYFRARPELLENFRGHCVFWNRRNKLPDYLRDKPKEEIRNAVLKERLGMIKRYPDIKEWDLLNEPLSREPRMVNGENDNETIFNPVEDLDFFIELFTKAKEVNPNARFYINEFHILNGKYTDEYIDLIQALKDKGVPIDGIGIQGHMWGKDVTMLAEAKDNLKKLSLLGLPIKITEFDVSAADFKSEKERAKYTEDMLTLFFGTPAVEGIYFWGFHNKVHWRGDENAGLVDDNFQPNETGRNYLKKVQKEWTTHTIIKTDEKGNLLFRGFPGDYSIAAVGADQARNYILITQKK
jgi:GH35 family endo-1,4-beta-xylanase